MQKLTAERKIKKKILSAPHRARITTAGGCENIVKSEIERILSTTVHPKKYNTEVYIEDGILIVDQISYRELLELTIRTKTARDVRWIISKHKVTGYNQLKKIVSRIDWNIFISNNATIVVRVESFKSRLYHEGQIKQICCDIMKTFGFQISNALDSEEIKNQLKIFFELRNDMLFIMLSLSGDPLFKRGYKEMLKTVASIKEDLASSANSYSFSTIQNIEEYKKEKSIILIPFAGSGTLGFEAVLQWIEIKDKMFFPLTNFKRDFAFNLFPSLPKKFFEFTNKKLNELFDEQMKDVCFPKIIFIEKDKNQTEYLIQNIKRFFSFIGQENVEKSEVMNQDFFTVDIEKACHEKKIIFVLLNPPYGNRLGNRQQTRVIYEKTAKWLEGLNIDKKQKVAGYCFFPDVELFKIFSKLAKKYTFSSMKVKHGGNWIILGAFQN